MASADLLREDVPSLWDELQESKLPIVLYGTGNGADKILDVLLSHGISPAGVFASEGFVRSRSFRGFPVRSYADFRSLYGRDMTVLVCFGSARNDVVGTVLRIAKECEVRIPDVPLFGGSLFDRPYYLSRLTRLKRTEEHLADDDSRKLFCNTVMFRLTGRPDYLAPVEEWPDSLQKLLPCESIRSALDGGAYRGDTAQVMSAVFPHLRHGIAVEPDPTSFRKLKVSSAVTGGPFRPVNALLGAASGDASLLATGGRSSVRSESVGSDGFRLAPKRASIVRLPVITIDELAKDDPLDFIKLDVEGEEAAVLRGASRTILRDHPALCVSVYHRTDDIMDIPEQILSVRRDYRLFLRRVPCIPAWDLSLYAIPE